jgi:hypothetical protein
MKKIKFDKKTNATELTKELINANFDIYGVVSSADETEIILKDTETKNPSKIVEKHIFTEYPKIKTLAERVEELEKKVILKE